jgi:hypothetical protein
MNAHELIEKVTEVKSLIAQETQNYDDSLDYTYERRSELLDVILTIGYGAHGFVGLILEGTKLLLQHHDKIANKELKDSCFFEASRLILFLTTIASNTHNIEDWAKEVNVIYKALKEIEEEG